MARQQAIPVEVLHRQMHELDAELERLQAELQRVTLKRDMLRELFAHAIDVPSQNGHSAAPKAPTLTDAVVDFIARHPGMTSSQIADTMIADYDARGKAVGGSDPRKTLLTTLGAVVQKARVRREDGRHYVNEPQRTL